MVFLVALAACKRADEVKVEQYNEVDAPVVGHGVRLYLGDVSNGKYAPIRVLGPRGEEIASGHLGIGDALPFTFDGRWYAVVAVQYFDHLIGDEGVLRVERRKPPSGPPILRVEENTGAPLPGLPGVSIEIDVIVDHHRADVRVVADARDGALVSQTVSAGDVIALEHARLTFVSFEGHTGDHDWALVRVESD
jgi:hypothetical protein